MVRVGTPVQRRHGRSTVTVAIGDGQKGDGCGTFVEARGGRVACVWATGGGGFLHKARHRTGYGTPGCGEDRSYQRGELVRRDGIGVAILDIQVRTVIS